MAKKEAPEGSLLREKSGERDLRMVHVMVLQGLASIVAGLAVHMALGPVRAGAGLLVALVRALLDGFGGHVGALPVLALLNLGVENFAGPAGRVGGQPCAAFAAFLALFADAVGGAPAGDGNVAELGFGDGGLGLVEADLRVSGIVDREVRGGVPVEEFVHHGVTFLAAPEEGVGGSRAAEAAADGAPVRNAAFEHFQHGEGELIVRSAVLFGKRADNGVEHAVAAGVALVVVGLVGHLLYRLHVKLVGLPSEVTACLLEALHFFRGSVGVFLRIDEAGAGRAAGDAAKAAENLTSVEVHKSSSLNAVELMSEQILFSVWLISGGRASFLQEYLCIKGISLCTTG